jgi:hypothetical protein
VDCGFSKLSPQFQIRNSKEVISKEVIRNSKTVVALVSGRPGKAKVAAMQPRLLPEKIGKLRFGVSDTGDVINHGGYSGNCGSD